MARSVPPPPKVQEPSAPWAVDPQAKAEEKNWDDEEKLRGQQAKNKLRFLINSGLLTVILMWFFAAVFTVSLAVWLIHYLAPIGWHWLTPEQLARIQAVIFSGSIGAIVSAFAQKQINS